MKEEKKIDLDELAKKISREVLSQLDDEQLKQIAGGARDDFSDADETCSNSVLCYSCNNAAVSE